MTRTSGEQLYRQAFLLSRQGRKSDAERCLKAAAAEGFMPARYTLAVNMLQAEGQAAALQARAMLVEDGGHLRFAPALQLVVMIALLGLAHPPDHAAALALLNEAAGRGMPGPLRQLAVAALLLEPMGTDLARSAVRLLGEAARRGDILAALILARLATDQPERGWTPQPLAPQVIAKLKEAGHPAARVAQIGAPPAPRGPMQPLETAACRHLSRLLDLITAAWDAERGPPPPARHEGREGYAVFVGKGLWPRYACDYVATLAMPLLKPSTVLDPETGKMRFHPVRRSNHATLFPWDQDLVTWILERRLMCLVDAPFTHGEMLCVLHYPPGGEYRPHLDALTAGEGMSGKEIERSGQRTHTILIRLSDEFVGGETHFPNAGLTMTLDVGDALVFPNCDENGRPDPRSLHAGLRVRDGVKWMATKWIRARPYRW